jgi:hypothetical protein
MHLILTWCYLDRMNVWNLAWVLWERTNASIIYSVSKMSSHLWYNISWLIWFNYKCYTYCICYYEKTTWWIIYLLHEICILVWQIFNICFFLSNYMLSLSNDVMIGFESYIVQCEQGVDVCISRISNDYC